MDSQIKIIITGGTIDNLDYRDVEKEPRGQKSLIPALLKQQARTTLVYKTEELMMKDSRFLGANERQMILKACRNSSEDKIIITHGTMTMVETAKFLGRRGLAKTIVLTGAMKPASQKNSDALFNLGTAIVAAQTLTKGVYITMHGQVFNWNRVKKNLKKKRFENA